MSAPLDYREGTIAQANDRGVKLEGDREWLNISRFAAPVPRIPPVGTRVRLGLDVKQFIRSIEESLPGVPGIPRTARPGPADHEPPARRDEPPPPDAGFEPDGAVPARIAAPPLAGVLPGRETVITRLACLKAAAHVLAAPDVTGDYPHGASANEVLRMAEQFEVWANRPVTPEASAAE
jgi:hypothetical protein